MVGKVGDLVKFFFGSRECVNRFLLEFLPNGFANGEDWNTGVLWRILGLVHEALARNTMVSKRYVLHNPRFVCHGTFLAAFSGSRLTDDGFWAFPETYTIRIQPFLNRKGLWIGILMFWLTRSVFRELLSTSLVAWAPHPPFPLFYVLQTPLWSSISDFLTPRHI